MRSGVLCRLLRALAPQSVTAAAALSNYRTRAAPYANDPALVERWGACAFGKRARSRSMRLAVALAAQRPSAEPASTCAHCPPHSPASELLLSLNRAAVARAELSGWLRAALARRLPHADATDPHKHKFIQAVC
uniref:Uncharacterized protein n=1 Tax=Heliothis virescens TaxID=7102 RepID=A0A2A4J163_HELVI